MLHNKITKMFHNGSLHADVLRASSRNHSFPTVGTRDEPLRTFAREATITVVTRKCYITSVK